jgi:gamma-glutamyltranspeptidase/glutathione hydrolase
MARTGVTRPTERLRFKMKKSIYTRREMLGVTGKVVLTSALAPQLCFARVEKSSTSFGAVVGEPVAAKIGEKFLRDGGNAIDAAIATAFASGITSPSKCGVGGYGGYAVIALASGKVTAIDFNSAAPLAAHEDMFPLDDKGRVKNNLNYHGWLAVGVPGTLAGLTLALERYGTRSLRDILAPTIQLCEEGVVLAKESKTQAALDASRNDPRPESVKQKEAAAQKEKNLKLAGLLKTLAKRNSAESFYRGDIAEKIADAFQRNGGLVTAKDLAAYHAREVHPLKTDWNGMTLHVAPLTSPGMMLLEAISVLKKLEWKKLSALLRLQAKLEAMRIAWSDRERFYGDPEKVKVPVERLLSSRHAEEMAEKVRAALKGKRPVALDLDSSDDAGTINISVVDKNGNMIAITLTHGSSFGSRVSVEEFGMVLGHGMWRFDPRLGRPNSPGPGKRCVNNMCPMAITRNEKPILAIGGAGGTRIPNSIYEVLVNYVGLGKTMEQAMNAPRFDTDGTLKLGLEKGYSPEEQTFLKGLGYKVSPSQSAYVSAVSWNAKTGGALGISTGGI